MPPSVLTRRGCVCALLSDGELWRPPMSEDDWAEHMESVHHVVVRREGESATAAMVRFVQAHPEAQACDVCRRREAPWTQP